MRLYLVQHGEACAKDVDPQRPLTRRGRDDMERLGAFLANAGIRIERIVHSGKLRAHQSAEILARSLAPALELEESGLINPNDNPQAFDWQSGSWDQDCLVIGHLPFMARLVGHLVVNDSERVIAAFEPGTMVCLIRDDGERWQIGWMVRPEILTHLPV